MFLPAQRKRKRATALFVAGDDALRDAEEEATDAAARSEEFERCSRTLDRNLQTVIYAAASSVRPALKDFLEAACDAGGGVGGGAGGAGPEQPEQMVPTALVETGLEAADRSVFVEGLVKFVGEDCATTASVVHLAAAQCWSIAGAREALDRHMQQQQQQQRRQQRQQRQQTQTETETEMAAAAIREENGDFDSQMSEAAAGAAAATTTAFWSRPDAHLGESGERGALSHGRNQGGTVLAVILSDLEAFDKSVLSQLVDMFSLRMAKDHPLPCAVVLIVLVSPVLDLPQNLSPKAARLLQVPPPPPPPSPGSAPSPPLALLCPTLRCPRASRQEGLSARHQPGAWTNLCSTLLKRAATARETMRPRLP